MTPSTNEPTISSQLINNQAVIISQLIHESSNEI
uniref:Uncharacterized protein n=1 Tax=viral metagenome TaxID=1070528 RepID=A0A6C0BLL9_9ZZZZ